MPIALPHRLAFALILGLGACGRGDVAASGAKAPDGPARRVVLITCDDLRADRLSCYGYERPTTPCIDAFARESVLFTNAWSTSSATLPAIASLMTGEVPSRTGVITDADVVMKSEATTLAEIARDAGFATAAVVSNGILRDQRAGRGDVGLQQGFTRYDDEMTPSPAGHGLLERSGADTTAAALRWLAEKRPERDRFFLWVHYSDPGGPYMPPAEHLAQFQRDHAAEPELPAGTTDSGAGAIPRTHVLEGVRRAGDYLDRYDAEVHAFDAAVGRLVGELEGRGWLQDALVIVTASHGVSFGEHGFWFSSGETLQRELVRVPLIVRPPAALRNELIEEPGGRRNGKLVMHLDVLPTIREALGIAPVPARGISLLAERLPEDRVAPQFLGRGDPLHDLVAVTDGRWRIVTAGARVPILFDVLADPLETKDLADKLPKTVASLQERWQALSRREEARSTP